MASERSRRRIERLPDEADEAFTQLDWESLDDRVTAVLTLEADMLMPKVCWPVPLGRVKEGLCREERYLCGY